MACADADEYGGKRPWLSGSGNVATPCERMQRENASAAASAVCCAELVGVAEELLCVGVVVEPSCATWLPGERPHAETSSGTPARREARVKMRDRPSTFTLSKIARRDDSRRNSG